MWRFLLLKCIQYTTYLVHILCSKRYINIFYGGFVIFFHYILMSFFSFSFFMTTENLWFFCAAFRCSFRFLTKINIFTLYYSWIRVSCLSLGKKHLEGNIWCYQYVWEIDYKSLFVNEFSLSWVDLSTCLPVCQHLLPERTVCPVFIFKEILKW